MKKAYSAIKHIQKGDMDLIQGNANPFPLEKFNDGTGRSDL